jgi:ABC-type glutathione transport system ATPase component
LLRGRGEPFGGRGEPPEGGQPLLEIRDLIKRYGTARRIPFGPATPVVTPVDDVSFDLRPGEAFAIVGESGSGKSTLAKLLAGLLEPTSGQIRFAALRRELQIVPQDSGSLLNPQRRVGATIAEPLVTDGLLGGEDERRQRVRALLELVGVDPQSAEHFPHELSAAQRRRVAIARAVALEPKLLILDAPLAGLDVFSQAHMLELLHRIRPAGVALILTGREAEGIRQICDRVAVLERGRLVESG